MDITSLWDGYAASMLPEEAGADQRHGTKLAFYGGCRALAQALHQADFKDLDACRRQLEALSAECARVMMERAYSN